MWIMSPENSVSVRNCASTDERQLHIPSSSACVTAECYYFSAEHLRGKINVGMNN